MLFTHGGMAVRFPEDKVRAMGRTARGVRGVNLKDRDDKVVSAEVVNGDESILIVCEKGFGKRSLVEEFRETNRGGVGVRSIVTSDRNGPVLGAQVVTDQDSLLLITSSGQTVRIPIKDIRVMGRNTQGVKLLNLKKGDSLTDFQKIESNGSDDEEDVEMSALPADEESIAPIDDE
jgi:DNA gyrase subunit A